MNIYLNSDRSCCFTGHRNIPAKDIPLIKKCIQEVIVSFSNLGFNTFITGGALGFDTLAAQTVLNMKTTIPDLRLVVAVPCLDQDKSWSIYQKSIYRHILERADKTICLNKQYVTGCMHQRNRFMVDNSTVCIAYLKSANGGTAYTVRYAESNDKEIVNLAELIK